jgi:hypothetical protein
MNDQSSSLFRAASDVVMRCYPCSWDVASPAASAAPSTRWATVPTEEIGMTWTIKEWLGPAHFRYHFHQDWEDVLAFITAWPERGWKPVTWEVRADA